ncbi:hypothetical protein HOLleu_14385 [Holothuria leucospilota]|uniref:Uncharacterized protein n=1 Tax=Holothuria leucospilota TaxID=206669 RepID=A0A9Q1C856_HOLLE|nr:hypothetical protein HOLleu_14385 [Holothuria leucospilota]
MPLRPACRACISPMRVPKLRLRESLANRGLQLFRRCHCIEQFEGWANHGCTNVWLRVNHGLLFASCCRNNARNLVTTEDEDPSNSIPSLKSPKSPNPASSRVVTPSSTELPVSLLSIKLKHHEHPSATAKSDQGRSLGEILKGMQIMTLSKRRTKWHAVR